MRAEDIKVRFLNEQNYAKRYVKFLHDASAIRDSDITKISTALHQYGLPELPKRQDRSKWHEPLSSEELSLIVESFRMLLPEVNRQIARYEQDLLEIPKPANLDRIDVRSDLGEWIQYIIEALENDASPEIIAWIRQDIREQEALMIAEMKDEDDVELLTPDEVDYTIQSALFLHTTKQLNELQYILDQYTNFDLAARMIQPEAGINILRQGFILILTALDAAVFDLVRVALMQDFFGLIGIFGKQEKISLETIAQYGSFETFRDSIIEEQLKGRYLKDLLSLLNNRGIEFVDEAAGEHFVEIIELVQRRNIHVHNRGVADERYLERDHQGIPRYNIYNLSLGDVAEIDNKYWDRMNLLCLHCIENLALWVDRQGIATSPAS